MNKDAIRICLLGGSGSGKTAFFSGIYQALVGGIVTIGKGTSTSRISLMVTGIRENNNFFTTEVEEDDQAIEAAVRAASEMDSNYLIRNYFMDSTAPGSSTEFTFELIVDDVKCCEMVITDYAGEVLDDPANVDGTSLNEVCKNLAESDANIIIADVAAIAEKPNNITHINSKVYNLRTNSIYDMISRIAKEKGRAITTLIALAKSDHTAIPDSIRRENFSEISHMLIQDNIYGKTFARTTGSGGSFGIIPVSAVGSGNTDERNRIKVDADIKQENIDVAIIFCIYNSVARIVKRKEMQIAELEAELKRTLLHLGKKIRQERKDNKIKLEELKKEKYLLSKILTAFEGDTSYFSERINEMHLSTNSQIGRVEYE